MWNSNKTEYEKSSKLKNAYGLAFPLKIVISGAWVHAWTLASFLSFPYFQTFNEHALLLKRNTFFWKRMFH